MSNEVETEEQWAKRIVAEYHATEEGAEQLANIKAIVASIVDGTYVKTKEN